MISTFISLSVPSQTVIGYAIGGLLILLIAAQLMDFEEPPVKSAMRYLQAFTTPLLVLFALVVIMRVFRIVA